MLDGPTILACLSAMAAVATVSFLRARRTQRADAVARSSSSPRRRSSMMLDSASLAAGVTVGLAIYGTGAVIYHVTVDGRAFTVLRHIYLAGVVVTPAIVLSLVAIEWRRGLTGPAAGTAGVAIALAATGVYATHVEPYWLRVDHIDVGVSSMGPGAIRVGVLSDIQTARVDGHTRSAVAEVMDRDPDVILIAGDLFQGGEAGFDRAVAGFTELMASLDAPHGVYVVEGDVDRVAWLREMTEGTDVRVLVDEIVELVIRDQVVRIGGIQLDWTSASSRAVADELARSDGESLTILLAHRPDAVLDLPPDAIDLTIAGHTHGGQVVIPLFGPPVTFSDVPRSAARGGLHRVAGNLLYVSTGVGLERGGAPQVRFGNRPSVGILDISNARELLSAAPG